MSRWGAPSRFRALRDRVARMVQRGLHKLGHVRTVKGKRR